MQLRIWTHLLKKPLMENFIFCAVSIRHYYYLRPFLEKFENKIFKNIIFLRLAFFEKIKKPIKLVHFLLNLGQN